jgi:hypothetical protein
LKEKRIFLANISLENFTDSQCKTVFRFYKEDLAKLKQSGIEALCILLRRLAYPNRLEDLTDIFSRPVYELSYIFNEVLNMILVYENHAHGIKFQMISAPNGLIINLFGPIEGCRHDSGMLRISGLMENLQDKMTRGDGNIYSLYGDPAYPLRPRLLCPFKGAHLTEEQKIFNKRMSAVRIYVEWTFGKIISLFSFLDFKKNNKLYLQPIGKYYIVGAILTNCHSCLYGNETGGFFELDPTTLDEYLIGHQ